MAVHFSPHPKHLASRGETVGSLVSRTYHRSTERGEVLAVPVLMRAVHALWGPKPKTKEKQ